MALGGTGAARSGTQGSEHRVVFVSVVDRQGNPVPGLTAANFKGEFRGRPVTIVSSAENTGPHHVAIIVDVSASQDGTIRSEWAQAGQLIDRLVPRASVAVFTLNGKLKKYADLTTDRNALQNATREAARHEPEGTSSLYDGIIEIAATSPTLGPGDAIYLFSDGEDDSSRHSVTDAVRILSGKEIRVFLTGELDVRQRGRVAAQAAWGTITSATGGWAMWINSVAPNADDVAVISSAMTLPIMSGYRLDLTLLASVDKARDWKLEVTEANGRPLKSVRVLYPRMLVPSGSQ